MEFRNSTVSNPGKAGGFSPYRKSAHQRHQVNARESVNIAFNDLRELIPTEPYNRKLSKIEILRLAKSYIEHLCAILTTGNAHHPCMASYLEDRRNTSSVSRPAICTFCVSSKEGEVSSQATST